VTVCKAWITPGHWWLVSISPGDPLQPHNQQFFLRLKNISESLGIRDHRLALEMYHQLLKCMKCFHEYCSNPLKGDPEWSIDCLEETVNWKLTRHRLTELVEAMIHEMLHTSKQSTWPKPKTKGYLSKDPILQECDSGNYHFIQHFEFWQLQII
jgi:hypothetical protein